MANFTGTSGDDVLPPKGADNTGDDDFFGLDGNDKMYGGLGEDSLDGGGEDDRLYGDDGDDFVSGGADNDRLYGGNGIDWLDGGGGNDILDGGVGADTMVGNFGDDKYYVDDVGDVLTEYQAADGLDRVYSTVTFTLGNWLDYLYLKGASNIDGTGSAQDNRIYGNGGDNVLNGMAGNDILDGGGGSDTMVGGTGNDIYYVNAAGDVADETGGDGTDSVYSDRNFNLGSAQALGNVENLTLTGVLNLSGTGNSLNNTISGNMGNNLLRGQDGVDTVKGNDGDDTLQGGNGDDTLQGGNGADSLTGNAGSDKLTGGADADSFILLSLNDSTVAAIGRDQITDFNSAQGDKIDLSAIDASAPVGGNDAFTFIGNGAFTNTAGQLRFAISGANIIVSGDVDGDSAADFSILVKNVATISGTDFVL